MERIEWVSDKNVGVEGSKLYLKLMFIFMRGESGVKKICPLFTTFVKLIKKWLKSIPSFILVWSRTVV